MKTGDPSHPLRVIFAPVATGDAVFVDTGTHLYLIDCGAGLDYARAVEALGHRHISGLVLTHAHADHWLALPDAMKQLGPGAWVTRPGMTLRPDLMRKQALFEFYDQPVDVDRLMTTWDAIPPRALAEVDAHGMWDVNAARSTPVVELAEPNWVTVHRACLVPAIRWGDRVALFGADLDSAQWEEIVPRLPRAIDLFQAPNHGGPTGRMTREVLDDHLRPSVVIVTDAQPIVDDHTEWYLGNGRSVFTLQERRTIVVTMGPDGVRVDVGGLELPMIAA